MSVAYLNNLSSSIPNWLKFLLYGILFVIGIPLILNLFFILSGGNPSIITYNPVQLLYSTFLWGTIYLSIAIGLTLGYKVFGFPNFAVGEYFLIGGYAALYLSNSRFFANGQNQQYLLYAVILFGMFISGIVALLVDLVVFNQLRKKDAGSQAMMIVSLGVSLSLRALISIRFGTGGYKIFVPQRAATSISIPSFYWRVPLDGFPYFQFNSGSDPIIWNVRQLDVIFISSIIFMVILLFAFLKLTKYGKGIRAVASNPDLAASSGINVQKLYMLTSFIIGGFSGVGGALFIARAPINPASALFYLLPAFAVIVLGTVGSLIGALIGAFIVAFFRFYSLPILSGLQQPLNRSYLPRYNEVMPFILLIGILLFYNRGIGENLENWFNSLSFENPFSKSKEQVKEEQ